MTAIVLQYIIMLEKYCFKLYLKFYVNYVVF